jgi:hypothetical protein
MAENGNSGQFKPGPRGGRQHNGAPGSVLTTSDSNQKEGMLEARRIRWSGSSSDRSEFGEALKTSGERTSISADPSVPAVLFPESP